MTSFVETLKENNAHASFGDATPFRRSPRGDRKGRKENNAHASVELEFSDAQSFRSLPREAREATLHSRSPEETETVISRTPVIKTKPSFQRFKAAVSKANSTSKFALLSVNFMSPDKKNAGQATPVALARMVANGDLTMDWLVLCQGIATWTSLREAHVHHPDIFADMGNQEFKAKGGEPRSQELVHASEGPPAEAPPPGFDARDDLPGPPPSPYDGPPLPSGPDDGLPPPPKDDLPREEAPPPVFDAHNDLPGPPPPDDDLPPAPPPDDDLPPVPPPDDLPREAPPPVFDAHDDLPGPPPPDDDLPPAPPPDDDAPARMRELFERYDLNSDGQLDKSEIQEMLDPMFEVDEQYLAMVSKKKHLKASFTPAALVLRVACVPFGVVDVRGLQRTRRANTANMSFSDTGVVYVWRKSRQ